MRGNKAGSITPQNGPGVADCVSACTLSVKYAVCVRVSMSVRRLISCVCGEGHTFNQAVCHLARKSCKLQKHPRSHTHTGADTHRRSLPRLTRGFESKNPRVALKVL